MSQDKRPDDNFDNKRNNSDLPYLEVNRDALSGRNVPSVKKNKSPLKKRKQQSGDAKPHRSRAAAPPPEKTPLFIASAKQPGDKWWWLGGFLLGFLIGFSMALTYGWVLDPRPVAITPANLRIEDKAFYLRLIALAYTHDNNEERARERLATLDYLDSEDAVVSLTEQFIEQEVDIRDILALVNLSQMFGQTTSPMMAFIVTPTPEPTSTATLAPTSTPRPTQTPIPTATSTPTKTRIPSQTPTRDTTDTPTPSPTLTPTKRPTRTPTHTPTATATSTSTSTPTATATPTPTRTPTVTNSPTPNPEAPFGVAQSVVLCEEDSTIKGGLLRIYVRDRLEQGVPGVKITVIWSGGTDTFFTGLKPEFDPGYADFQMEPGQRYQVQLNRVDFTGSIPEINIDSKTLCPNLPSNINPSWQVVFKQGVNG